MRKSKNDFDSLNMANKSAIDENYHIPTKKEQYNSSKGGIMCPKCNENYINEYCRTCIEFICSDYKDNNNNNNNYLIIHLIMGDSKDNINLYCNLIQTDIEENINNNNELLNKGKIIDIFEQSILIGDNIRNFKK